MTNIEAKEVKVGDLFSPNFMFNIPIYQRNLSWSSEDFDLLFEDIYDAMNNGQNQYFLGSVLLQNTEEDKLYEIVDGQQRLTSLSILLAVLRDNSEDKENINKYLYQKEDKYKKIPAKIRITPWMDLSDLFNNYIYSIDGTEKFLENFSSGKIQYKDTQDPIYHMYEGIKTFKSKIENLENREEYLIYLLNNVYMVHIITNTFESAYRLFNVLNARGVPLSTYDLLKSENLGEITNKHEREKEAIKLRSIENTLGLKDLDKVIGYIRTIKAQDKVRTNIYEEYRSLFDKGLLKRGTDFITCLDKISLIYQKKILEPELNTNSEDENRYKIIIDLMNSYIPNSDWIPPLIAFYDKFGSDENLLEFTLMLEKKVLVEWMAGFSPTERITSLNKIIKLIDITVSSEEVVQQLLYYKPKDVTRGRARVLDFSNENEIKTIITTKLNDNQLYSIYGGKLARYILLRLDMDLWDLNAFQGYNGMITVEHILPQNPSKTSKWLNLFNREEMDNWTNKLGNLVLLSGRKNSQARNFDFDRKKDVYFAKKSASFQITQQIRNYEIWNPNNLIKRHDELLEKFLNIYLNQN